MNILAAFAARASGSSFQATRGNQQQEKRQGGKAGVWSLAGLAIAAMAGLTGFAALAEPAAPTLAAPGTEAAAVAPQDPQAAAVARGAYVAALGDCAACHTAPGGKPLAGGLPLTTPFGPVYATNITPDPATGIGRYTFEQFDRVMRKGVAADGHNLYPAMPYPSFAKISDADMHDLYTYLMHGVPPVQQANKPLGVKWPFSMRWGLSLWNWVFLEHAPFKPSPQHDAAWNRGAYLVQSLGHCGACHTPRGIGFQEKALTEAGSNGHLYLAGAKVEAWNAANLRGLWNQADLVTLLKTGQNPYGVAAGGMADVVHNSTQYMTEADLKAMAAYMISLGSNGAAASTAAAAAEPDGLYTTKGGLGYVQFCSSCHQTDGRGFEPVFPGLAQNLAVQSGDSDSLIHIALTGWKSAQTQTYPRVYTMPGFDQLSDSELADILSFVRAAWSGHKDAISAEQVGKLRKDVVAKAAPAGQKVNVDTPRFATLLDAPNAQQLVRGLRLNLQTKALLPDNVGNLLNCTSCHLNNGTVASAAPYVGLPAQFPSYAARAGKVITFADRINGCFVRSMNGKVLPVDSDDMKAMVAYSEWMNNGHHMKDKIPGRGVGKIDNSIQPDLAHGKEVYAAQCASCHGDDGQGGKRGDQLIYPPLWGDQSFNIGAGMARLYTAAAFVKNNMPISSHNRFPLGQGGLSDQDAVDVAAYFTTQPRPDFPSKAHDWPNGGKPKDSRY